MLKVTPRIHGTDEVTLEVDAEFKLLGAGAVDGIPDHLQPQVHIQGAAADRRVGGAGRPDDEIRDEHHHRNPGPQPDPAIQKQHDQQRRWRHADRLETAPLGSAAHRISHLARVVGNGNPVGA